MSDEIVPGPLNVNHWRYTKEGVKIVEEKMWDVFCQMPNVLSDPYFHTLYLQTMYETESGWYDHTDNSKPYTFGLVLSHLNPRDMIEKRYDELIDLEIPKYTNMSLNELLDLPSHEHRYLLYKFRKRDEIRRKKIDEARDGANKDNHPGNNARHRN